MLLLVGKNLLLFFWPENNLLPKLAKMYLYRYFSIVYNKDKLRESKHKGGKQNDNLSWNYRTRTCTDDVSWNRLRSTGKVK